MAGRIGQLKIEILRRLLEEEDYVLIVVNPACAGVRLPDELMAAGQPVALHIGYRTAIPIPDLRLDEQGISGTLSFRRQPFGCQLPWPSLLQVSVGEEHLVWLAPPPPPEERPRHGVEPASRERPKLRLVD